MAKLKYTYKLLRWNGTLNKKNNRDVNLTWIQTYEGPQMNNLKQSNSKYTDLCMNKGIIEENEPVDWESPSVLQGQAFIATLTHQPPRRLPQRLL